MCLLLHMQRSASSLLLFSKHASFALLDTRRVIVRGSGFFGSAKFLSHRLERPQLYSSISLFLVLFG